MSALALLERFAPAYAWADTRSASLGPQAGLPGATASENALNIEIARLPFTVNGREGRAIVANGSLPGPLLRLREGQEALIRVSNRLAETTSIHWHGLILPPGMDGVPG